MPTLRLFAGAREAAGTDQDTIAGDTVGAVVEAACARYGQHFTDLVGSCKVWVNGEPATADTSVSDNDEVAILPPVSGGA